MVPFKSALACLTGLEEEGVISLMIKFDTEKMDQKLKTAMEFIKSVEEDQVGSENENNQEETKVA